MPSRADTLALLALQEGRLIVNVDKGEIWRRDKRAEIVDKRSGYGLVLVSQRAPHSKALAHRIVWMAAHGPIPGRLQVNHRNRHRWDNRITNLELVTPAGNSRHAYAQPYDAVGGNVDLDWLERLDHGEVRQREERTEELMRPDHLARGATTIWRQFV